MKSVRPWLVILISVLVGAAAVYLAAQWVGQQAAVATKKVVVATRDLELGTRLRGDMVEVVDWPAGASLKEAVDPAKIKDLDGRVLNRQVLRGEPIVAAKLAAPGAQGGLSAVLGEGRRAITVKVNEIVGVAGFALPGNYVDVMVNTPDDATNKPVSKIVLEHIMVLAVAQDVASNDNKPRVVNAVTLDVTPKEAELIDLSRSIGSLSLVLRSQTDTASVATTGARKADLIKRSPEPVVPVVPVVAVDDARKAAGAGPVQPVVRKAAPKAAAPAAAVPKAPSVEVIRGIKRTEEVLPDETTQ